VGGWLSFGVSKFHSLRQIIMYCTFPLHTYNPLSFLSCFWYTGDISFSFRPTFLSRPFLIFARQSDILNVRIFFPFLLFVRFLSFYVYIHFSIYRSYQLLSSFSTFLCATTVTQNILFLSFFFQYEQIFFYISANYFLLIFFTLHTDYINCYCIRYI
jgi:hypothetical protein